MPLTTSVAEKRIEFTHSALSFGQKTLQSSVWLVGIGERDRAFSDEIGKRLGAPSLQGELLGLPLPCDVISTPTGVIEVVYGESRFGQESDFDSLGDVPTADTSFAGRGLSRHLGEKSHPHRGTGWLFAVSQERNAQVATPS